MIDEEALASIEKLHKLKQDGIITELDFETAKDRLLSGANSSLSARNNKKLPLSLPGDDDHFGWMTLPLKRFAQFDGRSTIKEFWMFFLFINLVVGALAIVAAVSASDYDGLGNIGFLAIGLIGIVLLGAFVPYLAVQVRRMHDQGKSGWFVALNMIPYIGWVIVLWFMIQESQPDNNRFGPNPLGE